MQNFYDLFSEGPFKKSDKLSDAKLHTTDGVTFQVHRFQLSIKNSYFKSMYCGDFSDSSDVVIKDIDGDTLGHVLYYLYTNKTVLNKENVMDVWIASDYFLADTLKQLCRDFVRQELDESNCLGVFLTVWNIEGLGIIDEFYRYLIVHFQSAMSSCLSDNDHISSERTNLDALKDLPFEAVKKILECTSLNVIDERMVWQVIVTWFGSDYQNKHQYIPELLKCMYKEGINEVLQAEMQDHTILKYHTKISQRLLEYCADGSRSPKSLYFVVHYNLSRNNLELNRIYVDVYLTFDDRLDIWTKIETVTGFCPDFIFQIDYNLYMFDSLGNRRIALNLLDYSTSPIPHPFINRSGYNVVSVLGQIYVLGGSTEDVDNRAIIERFDPASNEWDIVTPMHLMILTEAIIMNDCIYAIGHIFGDMTMQVFNPVSEEWYFVELPINFRLAFTSVVYKGKLYIIGGFDNESYVRTAEEYDPEEDKWRSLPDLPIEYSAPKAIHHQNLLIVYENRRFNVTSFPVFWDAENEVWVKIERSSPLFNVHRYLFCNVHQPDIVKGIIKNKRSSDVEWVTSNFA